jgi:hypothetical protein
VIMQPISGNKVLEDVKENALLLEIRFYVMLECSLFLEIRF